jgi:hypothetical protein
LSREGIVGGDEGGLATTTLCIRRVSKVNKGKKLQKLGEYARSIGEERLMQAQAPNL